MIHQKLEMSYPDYVSYLNPNTIQLIFGRGTHPTISPIILRKTRSNYSHVGYIDPLTGLIIESAGGIGVRIVTFEQFIAKYPNIHVSTMFVPDARYTRAYLISQLGKPYDTKAIWGILFNRDWGMENAWTCSELIAKGAATYRRGRLHRITQENLYANSLHSYFYFSLFDSVKNQEICLFDFDSQKEYLYNIGEEVGWPRKLPRPRPEPI